MTPAEPKIIGFLCETGAYVLYDLSNPARRKLPPRFVGLPVHTLAQVGKQEVLKALLAGAAGVLLAGGDDCCPPAQRQQDEEAFAALQHDLSPLGVTPQRLRLEWISAVEEKRLIEVLQEMRATLRRLPALRLAAAARDQIEHCG